MLRLIFSPVGKALVGVAVLGVVVFLSIQFGKEQQKAEQLQIEIEEFQETTETVRESVRNVRKANPNRDAAVALEQLRVRQQSR